MLNIAIFGAPGAGKGTQAQSIIDKYNLKYISTGNILRNEIANGTPLGLEAKAIIEKGNLVSDELVTKIIEKFIADNRNPNGFLRRISTHTRTGKEPRRNSEARRNGTLLPLEHGCATRRTHQAYDASCTGRKPCRRHSRSLRKPSQGIRRKDFPRHGTLSESGQSDVD